MQIELNAEQRRAADALLAAAMAAVFKPYSPDAPAAGRVIALHGGAGTGKTEVLLTVGRRLLEEKIKRDREAARARLEKAAAESRARQATEESREDVDFDDYDEGPGDVDFDDNAPARKPYRVPDPPGVHFFKAPKPKTAAEMRAEIKAAKEAAAVEEMEAFNVSFSDFNPEEDLV